MAFVLSEWKGNMTFTIPSGKMSDLVTGMREGTLAHGSTLSSFPRSFLQGIWEEGFYHNWLLFLKGAALRQFISLSPPAPITSSLPFPLLLSPSLSHSSLPLYFLLSFSYPIESWKIQKTINREIIKVISNPVPWKVCFGWRENECVWGVCVCVCVCVLLCMYTQMCAVCAALCFRAF